MNPARKFTLFTFLFALTVAGISDYAAVSLFRSRFMKFSVSGIADLIQIHAFKELESFDFSAQDLKLAQKKFKVFFEDIHSSGVIRLEAWSSSGRILFSDDSALIGKDFSENKKFQEALSGAITTETPMKHGYDASLLTEVWVPVFFSSEGGTPSGVMRVRVNFDETDRLAHDTHILVAVIFLFGVLMYWFVTVFVFKNFILTSMRDFDKFKLAAEYASDHIILTNREGVILYANTAAEKITGYTRKELIGARPSLWGNRMPPEFYQKLWRTIKDEKKVFMGEIENRRKNGELYTAYITITPVVENGIVNFFVGIERDITEEKIKEKMRTDFMTLTSHQLRTPLSGTKWIIETLQKGVFGPVNEKQKEYLGVLDSSNKKMLELVSDLLNIVRWESGKQVEPEIINVDSLFGELMAKFASVAASRDVILESGLSRYSGWKLKISKHFFCSILENILSNAITYSPPKHKVVLSVFEEGALLVFSVRDFGIGIPQEEQKKIFERFYRALNAIRFKPEGTGLGLSVAAELAKKIGVKISFQSEENKGSVFFVRVPKFS